MISTTATTTRLKAELWRRFGSAEYPAEWDGRVHGGGKLSQRFWEYFIGVELLDLDATSVVLDIGGGSPATGAGFFAALLAHAARGVIVLDPQVSATARGPANIEFIRRNGDYDTLAEILRQRPDITHVSCISVLEHVAPAIRIGMVRAINDCFGGAMFVATFEYHAKHRFFDEQLTAGSVSDLFQPLTRFYLDAFEAAPIWCENAYATDRLVRFQRQRPLARENFAPAFIPQWYPVATRFRKMESGV